MNDDVCTEKKNFVLLIGAMKSGTTSLFRILSQHPSISFCREKEPEFFSDDAIYQRGLDWYLSLWDWDPAQHKVCLEASTGYTKYPQRQHVPEKIAELTDLSFRFVYIMRHPFERIESHVRHGLYAGWTKSLDEGLQEKDGVVEITRYASQIDEYLKFFPRESLLLLTLEEFKQEPEMVLTKICQHIGVDDAFEFTGLKMKSNNGERYEAPKFVNKLGESRNYFSRILLSILKKIYRTSKKYPLWRKYPIKINRGRHQITEKEREDIFELLKPDLKRLQDEHSIDIEKLWDIKL